MVIWREQCFSGELLTEPCVGFLRGPVEASGLHLLGSGGFICRSWLKLIKIVLFDQLRLDLQILKKMEKQMLDINVLYVCKPV